jgi:hypothetical protein
MQWRLPLDTSNYYVRRNVQSVQCGTVPGSDPPLPINGTSYSNYVLFEPDGTKHGFWPSPTGVFGSQCTDHDPSRLYATDGSVWVIDQHDGIIRKVISKTGTQITFQDSGGSGELRIPES